MTAPAMPRCIHVDPNMHPEMYRSIIAFALVFDKTSLYAVSGKCLDRYGPLSADEFLDLVDDPDSPFLLTVPSDWYSPQERAKRNPDVVGWHYLDDRIVSDPRLREKVIQVPKPGDGSDTPSSTQIRDAAWDLALWYHDFLRREKIGTLAFSGDPKFTRIHTACVLARSQFTEDFLKYSKVVETAPDKKAAQLSYSGEMPAIFYQKFTAGDPKHTDNYRDLLKAGDVMSCLMFEHLTKPQIIQALHAAMRNRGFEHELAMYIPHRWHQLLMGGLSMSSTGDFIDQKLKNQAARALISERFAKELQPTSDEPLSIAAVKEARRFGLPRYLRAIMDKHLRAVISAQTPAQQERALGEMVEHISAVCCRASGHWVLTKSAVDHLVRICIGAGLLCAIQHLPDKDQASASYLALIPDLHRLNDWLGKLLLERWIRNVPPFKRSYALNLFAPWFKSGQPSGLESPSVMYGSPP